MRPRGRVASLWRAAQARRYQLLLSPAIVREVARVLREDFLILECAIVGHADLIVSGDRHLLKLKSYEGVPIVRPIDFRRSLGLVE